MPDFIGLGGMRCGSTMLWNMLRRQPDIFLPDRKELHYFDNKDGLYDRGLQAYLDYFADAGSDQVCGEITPDYLSVASCCDRIFAVAPRARLIVILRDPIGRAWSHYRMSVNWGGESKSFMAALRMEGSRLQKADIRENVAFSYKERGRYVEHLKRYEARFGRGALLVILLSELKDQPQETLRQVREHIGLPPDQPATAGRDDEMRNFVQPMPRSIWLHHLMVQARSKARAGETLAHRISRKVFEHTIALNRRRADPPMDATAFSYLSEYYAPYDRQLEEWLGRPVPWRRDD